jgi:protein TonB
VTHPSNNTTSMTGSTYLQTRTRRKPWGLGVVVLLHLLVFWAIQAGLSRDITRQLPQVVQAVLLQETPPPPPPPPVPAASARLLTQRPHRLGCSPWVPTSSA